ncbi:MAG: hypothetical protein L6420_02865 [Elusimicrobia bacterium]|nr:hypothetical protein [Elusimicrobiota bacterium]
MRLFFFIFGFLSLLFQIFSLREISYLFSAHEISLASALAAWIFWTAVGAVKISKTSFFSYIYEKKDAAEIFFISFVLIFPCWLKIIDYSKNFLQYGTVPDFFTMLIMSAALTSLPAILNGICIYVAVTERGVNFYIYETIGAMASGIFSILYLLFFPQLNVFKLIFMISAPAAFLFLFLLKKNHLKQLLISAIAVLALSVSVFYESDKPFLTVETQTTYSKLKAKKMANQMLIFENGNISAQYPDLQFEEGVTAIPLLAHENPKKILFTSSEGIYFKNQVKKYNPSDIDIADNDRRKFKWLSNILDISVSDVNFIKQDARQYLKNSAKNYDLIFITNGDPENASINRFYTREFFALAAKKLDKQGILVFQIPSSENYLSPASAYLSAGILKTVKNRFENIQFVPGEKMTVLASNSKINIKTEFLQKRYKARHIKNKIYVPSNFDFILGKFRTEWLHLRLKKVKNPQINADYYPVSYFYLWKIWLSTFVSNKLMLGGAFVLIIMAAVFVKTIKNIRLLISNPLLPYSFILGFWSIVLEMTVLSVFQLKTGDLTWKLGLLFAAFMAGTAFGAYRFRKINSPKIIGFIFSGAAILTLLFLSSLKVISLLGPNTLFGVLILFLVATGFVIGVFFPLAVNMNKTQAHKIYAFDLWGSALGGFMAAAFFMPLLGIGKILIILAAITAIFIWPAFRVKSLRD